LLSGEYTERFKDLKTSFNLQLAYRPHLVDVNQAPDHLKTEWIELSEGSILKSSFDTEKDSIEV